jgi:hypothetical protein
MSAEQLDAQERSSFLDWRRELAQLEEQEKLVLTPFERNLEVWRQLWRVLERSDIVVQVGGLLGCWCVRLVWGLLGGCDAGGGCDEALHGVVPALVARAQPHILQPSACKHMHAQGVDHGPVNP